MLEIERTYLLSAVPPYVKTVTPKHLRQGYIPGDRLIERVRSIRMNGTETYVRTVKTGMGVTRIEIEEETTQEIFEVLWGLTVERRVEKKRYVIPDGESFLEIDVFSDRQLVLAEIELNSEDDEVVFQSGWSPTSCAT